jgi:hypothetical protein
MRKMSVVVLAAAAIMLASTSLLAQDETKWLDPANCHFCQPLTEPEGLLESLGWEHHKIAHGSMSVTTYKPEWKENFEAASVKMTELWVTFDPAQEYQLCGMCQAWMGLPMDKVTFESVKFNGGEIGMSTSTDPEVVAQLHALTDKTIAEYEAMMKMEMPEGHEGHGHE